MGIPPILPTHSFNLTYTQVSAADLSFPHNVRLVEGNNCQNSLQLLHCCIIASSPTFAHHKTHAIPITTICNVGLLRPHSHTCSKAEQPNVMPKLYSPLSQAKHSKGPLLNNDLYQVWVVDCQLSTGQLSTAVSIYDIQFAIAPTTTG